VDFSWNKKLVAFDELLTHQNLNPVVASARLIL